VSERVCVRVRVRARASVCVRFSQQEESQGVYTCVGGWVGGWMGGWMGG